MSKEKLLQTFGKSKVFLPVIHPVSKEIALNSIQVAVDAKADGIFLINQGMSSKEVLLLADEVNSIYPDLWIGVNLLDSHPVGMLHHSIGHPVKGVWADNAEVNEFAEEQTVASCFKTATRVNNWNGLYFGGVAFKYQRPVLDENLSKAARCAVPFMDVIMTSGPGTGMQSDVQKVQLMKEGAGEHPLGLASGVSPENVNTFLPYVDVFLVASGIETSRYSGILIPERTQSLSEAIHSYHV